jgi:hypothetical protein
VLEEYITEEQRSVVLFWGGQKDNAKDIHKKIFPVGSVCRVKRFHLGGKIFTDNEEDETETRKWLRQ